MRQRQMMKWWPIVVVALLALVAWMWFCSIKGKPVVPLIGWSPYNTSPMPAAPAPSSNVMGMNVQAR